MDEIDDRVVGKSELDLQLDLELAPAHLLDLEGEAIDLADGIAAGWMEMEDYFFYEVG